MPIYEYLCSNCDSKFEALRTMKDADAVIECKKCGSNETRRMLSVCQTHVPGSASKTSSGGCAGCSGGSCASCGH